MYIETSSMNGLKQLIASKDWIELLHFIIPLHDLPPTYAKRLETKNVAIVWFVTITLKYG
ncbi:hypothetical protein BLOT_009091 [Blomia tropicalis]|nr:hypothetical protein BLOT_009091 [Blomia tropicalis]